MIQALWVAKTGLDAQQTQMTVISNNLANVNTTAFKSDRASFQDLLYQNARQPGGATSEETQLPSGLTTGTGVRIVSTEKTYTEGNLQQTGNALDLAINGRGFFQVLMPDGSTAYTRDGSFQTNAQGQLVTASGYAVQPAVQIPSAAQSITIGTDGTVGVQLAGQAVPVQVGTLTLTDFINPPGLQARGENLLQETASSGPAQQATPGISGMGTLQQGSLESSNVNVVEQLVDMIETQRAYEMNSKAISTVDDMLSHLTNNM
jgi:flagellar basal-body rod protein FlgG